jgi:hypothetical protein
MNFSQYTSDEPNAAPASDWQASNDCMTSPRSFTMRIPRPPPPAAALKMSG